LSLKIKFLRVDPFLSEGDAGDLKFFWFHKSQEKSKIIEIPASPSTNWLLEILIMSLISLIRKCRGFKMKYKLFDNLEVSHHPQLNNLIKIRKLCNLNLKSWVWLIPIHRAFSFKFSFFLIKISRVSLSFQKLRSNFLIYMGVSTILSKSYQNENHVE
jgi:hypothetical protein